MDIGHEPPLEPPHEPYILAKCCGKEIYAHDVVAVGSLSFTEKDGTICEDCLDEKYKELSFEEKADLFGLKMATGLDLMQGRE